MMMRELPVAPGQVDLLEFLRLLQEKIKSEPNIQVASSLALQVELEPLFDSESGRASPA